MEASGEPLFGRLASLYGYAEEANLKELDGIFEPAG